MGIVSSRIEDAFSAPSFRQYQKESINEILSGLEGDADVIVYVAPTGSGKSLVLDGVANAYDGSSFVTTPLNSLVDQIDNDEFITTPTLKGRNNYECIHPEDEGTTVDSAICQRDSDFTCEMKSQCPYYGRKETISHSKVGGTNLAYLMAESMIPKQAESRLDDRDLLIIDECQSIEDFGLSFVSVTLSKRTVPDNIWYNITLPSEEKLDDMDHLTNWLVSDVLSKATDEKQRLEGRTVMNEQQVKDLEKINQFIGRFNNFITDQKEHDWVAQKDIQVEKNAPNNEKLIFEPITIGRFLSDMLYSRGDKIVLSSATIPSGGWLDEIGLGEKNVKRITVPSTFPIENRPIVTKFASEVGKMTYTQREDNAQDMVEMIKHLADFHSGEKGFVHCRSYSMMEMLYRSLLNNGHREWAEANVMLQDQGNREESLREWKENDIQVFFSVAMDEGVDLKDDSCRWQVLAKVLYPSLANKRIKYRMWVRGECKDCGNKQEFWNKNIPSKCPECGSNRFGGDWDWYNSTAAVQIQQAYGRGVRSKDDECVFYILDESAIGLIQRNKELFNDWFLEAIQW